MNTFLNQLESDANYGYTENGAVKKLSTNNPICDLFAMGAAFRSRSDEDCIFLFKNAYEYDSTLALKCLFWIRDCRGGAGERRFFRVCLKWLAENYPAKTRLLIPYVPEYGRYDDWFELFGTPVEKSVIESIRDQLLTDLLSEKNGVSLLAKWCPSENASSPTTKARAKKIRISLGMTAKEYRQLLSLLRKKINILERLMSANKWEEIEFDKIPSRAGIIYKNAFARRDVITERYASFIKDKKTKVNVSVLYPYEVVSEAIKFDRWSNTADTDREVINKYWENLPDYLEGKECSMLCVVDTSGSMLGYYGQSAAPINVAVSLGMYCAERVGEPFKNHYISFSSRPKLVKVEGIDFVDKVDRIYKTNICENTNLTAVFDLLLNAVLRRGVKKEDIPKTIVIISDMEIDQGTGRGSYFNRQYTETPEVLTEMEQNRRKWAAVGYELPRLVYWNVNARNNTILDSGPNVSFVSGMSPVLFKQVLTGKNGWDLCLETILSERYECIK